MFEKKTSVERLRVWFFGITAAAHFQNISFLGVKLHLKTLVSGLVLSEREWIGFEASKSWYSLSLSQERLGG